LAPPKGDTILKHAIRYFAVPVTALVFCLFASIASAETIAETVTKWGLIGA
jgi:ABC-type dipeptide/oligopeptide/nickel transport system permease component